MYLKSYFRYGKSVITISNCVRGGVSVRVVEIVGKGVNIGVYFGFDISDGCTFGIDDEFEMVYSGGFFQSLNDGKPGIAFRN